MFYSILWLVLLLSAIIAVPVASFLEKARNKRLAEESFAGNEMVQGEPSSQYDEPTAEPIAEVPNEFDAPAAAADDFSAFDDFK